MDIQQSTAESLRESIEELVAKKDIHGAVVQCEELEILASLKLNSYDSSVAVRVSISWPFNGLPQVTN